MPSKPKKRNNRSSQTKFKYEEWLAQYSFSLASIFFLVLSQFQNYLVSVDPSEQMFYDNLMFFAYIIFGFPLLFRIISFFRRFLKKNDIPKHLTRHQKNTYETYKIYKNTFRTEQDEIEKAEQILYFTAMNNWMWFFYRLILIFIFVTVFVNRLFGVTLLLLNCIPSLVLLIYRIFRIKFRRIPIEKID